jgi:type I restriction enzyme S subunit
MIKELTMEKTSLPAGWEMKTLGEFCSFQNGFAFKSKTYKDEGIPVVRITNIQDESIDLSKIVYIDPKDYNKDLSKYKIIKGDLLIAMSGATTGKIGIHNTEEELLLNQRVGKFEPSENLNKTYLLNFLKTKVEESLAISAGAAQPNLSTEQIKNFQIPLPPLTQQKQIVAILDKAFATIDTAKANAEQNLQNAKELFESYLQNVFENKGDDWEEKTLGDVLQKTETVNPKSTPNNEFVYLDVSSVNKETKLIEKTTTLLGKDAPSRARKLVKTNDIIFATVRPTHSRVAIITDEYNNQVCSTGYYVLRPKSIIENHYLFYFILTFSFNKLMESMQKGASYPAVNNKEVESVVINFPKSIKEQQKIVERLDSLSTETKKLEAIYTQKIADLEEMKKSVLQKAFSGQLNTIN